MTRRRGWEIAATLLLVVVVAAVAWGAYRYETWKRCSAELRALLSESPDSPRMRRLLHQGADIRVRTDTGETVLMVAAKCRAPDLVEQALARGLNPNDVDQNGNTALTSAIYGESAPVEPAEPPELHAVLRLLIAHGADVNLTSPLAMAARLDQPGVIRILHAAGARLNDRDELAGWTALSVAAVWGKARSVDTLLQLGADPSIKAKDGATAAQLAGPGGSGLVTMMRKDGFTKPEIAEVEAAFRQTRRVFAAYKVDARSASKAAPAR